MDKDQQQQTGDIKSIADAMTKHFKEDAINFEKINEANQTQEEDHKNFYIMLNTIQENQKVTAEFMENLSSLSDLMRGAGLLRKPALWVLGLIIGIVALMGGLKTIINYFVIK